jgi:hypothetical protein
MNKINKIMILALCLLLAISIVTATRFNPKASDWKTAVSPNEEVIQTLKENHPDFDRKYFHKRYHKYRKHSINNNFDKTHDEYIEKLTKKLNLPKNATKEQLKEKLHVWNKDNEGLWDTTGKNKNFECRR